MQKKACLLPVLALALILAFPCALGEETEAPYTIENGVLTVAEGITGLGNPWLEWDDEDYDLWLEWEEEGGGSYSITDITYDYFLTHIILPSTLRRLNSYSFMTIQCPDELVLPEGVEEIHAPFYRCGFRRIVLPSTLRVFDGLNSIYSDDLDQLEEIVVAADNPYFKSVDGVLFTADMKTLLYYPVAKQGVHYDVPDGVLTIGRRAFWGNLYLESVSLPIGLTKIEWAAFADCHSLLSVSFPLTLQSVAEDAFARCLLLKRAPVPSQTSVDENAFRGCTSFSEFITEAEDPDLHQIIAALKRSPAATAAFLCPENASDPIFILAQSREDDDVIGQFQSGSYVEIIGEENGYYAVSFYVSGYQPVSGYVPMDEVTLIAPYQGLFTVSSARFRRDGVYGYSKPYTLPKNHDLAVPESPFSSDTPILPKDLYGQWLLCSYPVPCEEEWWRDIAFFSLSDLILTRPYTGDERTFGVVITLDPRDWLHLRAEPERTSQSLGKFFTGTQVEILEEAGDWYRVRVGFDEGYMMRDLIMIVEQEEAEP